MKNEEAKKTHDPGEIPGSAEFEVVALEAENIKRLKAVKLALKGKSFVVIGGMNEQGKTSLVDCIPIALGGKKYEPEEVIRRGESHGKIVLDLDEVNPDGDPIGLRATVVFTKKAGRKFILEAKDGFPFRSPQEILDQFFNRLTFDPLEFVRLDKDKQTEVVRKLAGIDFTQIDAEYQILYNDRSGLNRDLKNANAMITSVDIPEGTPEEPIDIKELITQRDAIQEDNAKNNDRLRKLEQLRKDIQAKTITKNQIEHDIEDLMERLDKVQVELKEMVDKESDWTERSKAIEFKTTDVIDEQIAWAQRINALVEKRHLYSTAIESKKSIEQSINAKEEEMEAIKVQKTKMLADAKYPVPGFKIDSDGMLLYNDLPFSQASGMQQIDVAIDMALAINPRLKLALVREGSIIDLNNLKRIRDRVEANGGKLIMERTGKGPEMSVIIEEGEIVDNRM